MNGTCPVCAPHFDTSRFVSPTPVQVRTWYLISIITSYCIRDILAPIRMARGPPLPPATAASRIQLAASSQPSTPTSPPNLDGLAVSVKSREGTSHLERVGTGEGTSTSWIARDASDSLPGTAASGGGSSARKFCLTCHKPSSVCICDLFQGRVDNITGITILQVSEM